MLIGNVTLEVIVLGSFFDFWNVTIELIGIQKREIINVKC